MGSGSEPAAILGAGALIGIGLYFGLRPPAEPVASTPAPRTIEDTASPLTPAASAPAEVTADARSTVQARAKAAVADIHDTLVQECWQPSAAETPEPSAISVGLSLSFDALGKVRGTGVIERREANRPDISQCLTDRVHALSIEGVGVPASVEVELRLP